MNKTRRRVGRSFPAGMLTTAITTMFVLAVVGACTTALAQTNATVTIDGTMHDFSTGAGLGGYEVGGTENHCEVCHGPPLSGTGPEWLHAQSGLGDYTSADWLYTNDANDGVGNMVASELTRKCMGCHEGDIAVDAYTGTPTAGNTVYVPNTEAFGTATVGVYNPMEVHHPVDIAYGSGTVPDEGLLEDPTTFLNPQGGGTIANTLLTGGAITCNSCHEQHNDRRFDLVGGDPSDDPQSGGTSEAHEFLKIDTLYLCFNCHVHDVPSGNKHHIPGRDDPYGDERTSDMNCALCHNITGAGTVDIPSCEDCHGLGSIDRDPAGSGIGWTTRGTPVDATDISTNNHHGGNKNLPYFDCAMCHADPLTGILTGNDFGTDFASSCYDCHDAIWEDGANVAPDDSPGNPGYQAFTFGNLTGVVDQTVTFDASAIVDEEGKPVAYQWSFGDGSLAEFPSHDPITTHTYTDFGVFPAVLSVTDGVNPPEYLQFTVTISPATTAPVADVWTVTPSGDAAFDITFENHSGSLVGTQGDGTLSFGIEFVGVIFWMEMWMDLSGDVFWGTGDVFFGNIDRDGTDILPPFISGVLFKTDGTVQTFAGARP